MHTDIERIAQTLTRTWRLGLADERPVQVRAMRSFPVRAFARSRSPELASERSAVLRQRGASTSE